jgi:23S rRNA pseudouridine1911/1915/1917 synthase
MALARMFPEFSRTRLKDWVSQGRVTVDGRLMRPRDAVAGGERVVLDAQPEQRVTSGPEAMELAVVFEDEDLLVLDKPPGLVVHPGAGNLRGTLMNGLLHRWPSLEVLPRAGIVHRLDKDTSGLLLVARTLESHTGLVRQMGAREISRGYLAVCNGVLTAGGTIDAPIARHPVDRLRMAVRSNGKPAVTRYRVQARFAAHTLVEVELESGRTHQIRVHFTHVGHALLGEPVYGCRMVIPPGGDAAVTEAVRNFRRQALHARKLAFAHPRTGLPLGFERPPPADLERLIEVLRRHAAERAQ